MTTNQVPRILFCSLSAKFSLYKEVLRSAQSFCADAIVIGCDSNADCVSAPEVDHFLEIPPLEDLSDLQLLEICRKNKITHILPTRDAELPFWAEKKQWLLENKIKTWVSEKSYIKNCADKLAFHAKWQDSAVTPIPTFNNIDKHSIKQWAVKERFGYGSRNINLNISTKQALELCGNLDQDLIFQPFISGKEFTAETWISQSGKCHSPLLRWRTKVIDGESHQTSIFHHPEWERLLRSVFLHLPGARGHCLAQVIVDRDEKLYLVEINPRLGGASPLALYAGLNSVAWHLMEEGGCASDIPMHSHFPEGMSLTKKAGQVFFNS